MSKAYNELGFTLFHIESFFKFHDSPMAKVAL